MAPFYSCNYIQNGINFYPNNTIKMCCFSEDAAVDACLTTEKPEDIVKGIFRKKAQMLDDFKKGNIYDTCKKCPNLQLGNWNPGLQKISRITLNHFMFCNLKCDHCGYVEGVENGTLLDTDHGRVLEIIQILKMSGLTTTPQLEFDVGGGEPSVAKGLFEIVRYCIDNAHRIHINSNAANYVPLFAEGCNKGLLNLTLTPDAGSREVFRKIKGKDNFEHTWKNIEKYISTCQRNVTVKFILQEGNIDDVENMIDTSARVGVPIIILSLDLRVPQAEQPHYAPYVAQFRALAAQKGLQVVRGPLLPEALWNSPPSPIPAKLKTFPIPVVSEAC